MAHGSKRFCEVCLPGENRRIKRSRKRTRADALSWALYDHDDRIGYWWYRHRRASSHGGCEECRIIGEETDRYAQCTICRDIDDMRYWSAKYRMGRSVPKYFRKMQDDFDKADRKRVERRLVQAYNAGLEQEDDARRLEFNKYYRDAAWQYW